MNPDHLERLVLALESIAASFRQWAAPAMVERALRPESAQQAAYLGPIAKTYEFHGERLTVAQIAERAGVSKATIYARMSRGASAEEAAGPQLRVRVKKVAPVAKSVAGPVAITAAPLTLAKEAEVTIPEDVKRTVAPPMPDRFASDDAVPTFSSLKPGQYADDGSAWARAVLGGNR